MFGSLLKIVTAPLDITASVVADVATLGGSLTDQDEPYTIKAAERLKQNTEDLCDPDK